jgi:phosphoenolpyruvate-protein kinase (PTS system EI component)
MDIHVALSAEKFDERLPKYTKGVGLIRGEYIFRRIGRYVTNTHCRRYMQCYLRYVLENFKDQPVWYRFCDAPSNEINLLKGNDFYILEEFPTVGIRGMRRAKQFPESFELEFRTVTEVAKEYSNLHVIFPYISQVSEVEFGLKMGLEVEFPNQFGIMIETPAAIFHALDFKKLGIQNFLLGMNDLSSLTIGAGRGSGFDNQLHPALLGWMQELRKTLSDSTLSVAGYLKPEFMEIANKIGFDNFIIHYSALPQFLGDHFSEFREINFMSEFKKEANRKRLFHWSNELLNRSREDDGVKLQGAGVVIRKCI